MYRNKIIYVLFTLFLSQLSFAQNNTNSPYTMFGYGDVRDGYSGEQRAMGGLAIGARSKTDINTLNPASYSSVDSMTFMFDLGTSVLVSSFNSTNGYNSKLNANIEYLTMQFPLSKNLGFSMGVLPYSFSGYSFYSTEYMPFELYPDTVTTTRTFYGNGGIAQVYSGLALKLFNHISLGVNAYYMFGSSVNTRYLSFSQSDFYSSVQKDSITVHNFRFRYGLQFWNTFNKKHDVSIGVIYEPKKKMSATYSQITGSVDDVEVPSQEAFSDFETPEIYGAGLNYRYNNKLTLGFDYSLQKWADAKFFGKTDTLNNRSKFVLGAEYIPSERGRRYFDRVHYRAGLSMSDAYYKLDGATQPKNYGISFGMGLPLKNSNTLVNTTFEFGKVGANSLLSETYFKFTLNAVFNENWFFKRKL
ncbi:MAG: hypothetical protein PHH37_04105 [Paludibacter sp.]|nr:hypothetical protein [Paludibacter sp.]